jgi:tetratricopeptide (TPR) repeat protein
MFWKILLLLIAGLSLVFGVLKAWWDAHRKKLGRNPKRDIIIALLVTFLTGIYPIIDLLKPNDILAWLKRIAESQVRIEGNIEQFTTGMGEPTRYQDSIPQSPNQDLRTLFQKGQIHLNNCNFDSAINAFNGCMSLKPLKPREKAALLIYIGISQHKQSKWDESIASCKEAAGWAEKADDLEAQAAVYRNLSLVCQDKQKYYIKIRK